MLVHIASWYYTYRNMPVLLVRSLIQWAHTSAGSVQAVMNIPQEWHVYMLLCDNKEYYIGITPNMQKRFLEHRNKLSLATREFSNIELVYCERYSNKYLAAKREKQFKGWSRAKKQMLVAGKLGVNICTEFDKV